MDGGGHPELELITRLHAAAERGDEHGVDELVCEFGRVSPQRVIPRLLVGLRDRSPVVIDAIGRAAEVLLRAAHARSFWAIDRSLRTSGAWPLTAEHVDWLATSLERGRVGALSLASMQRDGFARARAIAGLGELTLDGLTACVLVVRLNDPVREVAEVAEQLLRGSLRSAPLHALVATLPLIDSADATVRAGRSAALSAIDERLVRGNQRALAALLAATRARDPDLRSAAIDRLARSSSALALALAAAALQAGLGDRDPRVRRACAELLARGGLPAALVDPLLPMLERARSPSIRLLGLRWRRRIGDKAAILRACFDRNAAIRHYARRYYRGLGGQADCRGLALARLGSSDVGELIGAIATLADLGRGSDRARIEPLAGHPTRAVANEAQRTLELLSLGVPEVVADE